MEIERHKGFIVKVGEATVKDLNLPDWNLSYIDFPPGQMVSYRTLLMKQRARIVKVTKERIYLEG